MTKAKVSVLYEGVAASITGADVDVCSLTSDSRRVAAGACFASLPGARVDGHAFIKDAIARGATSVLCEREVETGAATRILVKDARAALALAARRFFGDPSQALCMVGVTGTNGKTTTTHLVEGLLAAAGRTPAVIGTLGYRYPGKEAFTGLTTPESVDLMALLAEMRAHGVAGVAMEVSSHALVQHRVGGVDYDVGAFTNLTHDHLDYHGTMEAYFEAKRLLFTTRLKRDGRAAINIDDTHGRRLAESFAGDFGDAAKGQGRLFGFSVSGDARAAVRLVSAKMLASGTHLLVQTPRGRLEVRSPLIGGFNVENLMTAIAIGEALELPHDVMARGLAAVNTVPGRIERVSGADSDILVVVDYAHTPDALDKVIAAVRAATTGRIICVFGCGGDRDPTKRPRMGEMVAKKADWAVLTSDNPRSESPEAIARAVEEGLKAAGAVPDLEKSGCAKGYVVELDRAKAIRIAVATAAKGDAVVLAGKGHETYQIIGKETRHFDDREEGRAALAERARGRG